MEIVHQKRKILKAMESNPKGNDNFATKLISTENLEKNVTEVRRKNQTYFFLVINLGDKFKVSFSGRLLKFCPRMYKE